MLLTAIGEAVERYKQSTEAATLSFRSFFRSAPRRLRTSFLPVLPVVSRDRYDDGSPQPLPILLHEPRYKLREGYLDLNLTVKCADDKRNVTPGNVDVCREREMERLRPLLGWSYLPFPACDCLARHGL